MKTVRRPRSIPPEVGRWRPASDPHRPLRPRLPRDLGSGAALDRRAVLGHLREGHGPALRGLEGEDQRSTERSTAAWRRPRRRVRRLGGWALALRPLALLRRPA